MLPSRRKDLAAGMPPVTAATWPEAARRYLAAAAAAHYVAIAEPVTRINPTQVGISDAVVTFTHMT
jgi:hypothetical protein